MIIIRNVYYTYIQGALSKLSLFGWKNAFITTCKKTLVPRNFHIFNTDINLFKALEFHDLQYQKSNIFSVNFCLLKASSQMLKLKTMLWNSLYEAPGTYTITLGCISNKAIYSCISIQVCKR